MALLWGGSARCSLGPAIWMGLAGHRRPWGGSQTQHNSMGMSFNWDALYQAKFALFLWDLKAMGWKLRGTKLALSGVQEKEFTEISEIGEPCCVAFCLTDPCSGLLPRDLI